MQLVLRQNMKCKYKATPHSHFFGHVELNWGFSGTKYIFKSQKTQEKSRFSPACWLTCGLVLWVFVNTLPCVPSVGLSLLPPTVNHHTGDVSVITSPSPEEQHAQAFEETGFSRAQAPFISQELLLTVRDAHWSWRPLRENAFEKKSKGPEQPVRFPTAWKSTFHWFGFFGSALMWFDASYFFFCFVFSSSVTRA